MSNIPDTPERAPSPIEAAQEKLKNLERCDEYGVRMISLDEYKTYFGDEPRFGNAYGECAYVRGYPFQKLLEENASERAHVASEYSEDGHLSLWVYPQLLELLHRAHTHAQKSSGKEPLDIRATTLQKFHDLFLEYQGEGRYRDEFKYKVGDVHANFIVEPLPPEEEEDLFRRRNMNERLDPETVALFEKFSSNPQTLSKDEFRRLLRTLSTNVHVWKQYQLQVVFSPWSLKRSIVGGRVSEDDAGNWVELRRDAKQGILATIVCIPDRSLVEEVVALASSNPELAHPVFDSRGRQVFPRSTGREVTRVESQ